VLRKTAGSSVQRVAQSAAMIALGLVVASSIANTITLHSYESAREVLVAIWIGVAVGWVALESFAPSDWRRLAPAAVSFVTLFAANRMLPDHQSVPRWTLSRDIGRAEPLEPARQYLSLATWEELMKRRHLEGAVRFSVDLEKPELRVGNLGLLAELSFVNGYSPMSLARLRPLIPLTVHGLVPDRRALEILERETGPRGLLEMAGVDGLVVGDALFRAVPAGWHLVAPVPGGVVLHRDGPPIPRAFAVDEALVVSSEKLAYATLYQRSEEVPAAALVEDGAPMQVRRFARAEVSDVRDERSSVRARVRVPSGGDAALLAFARPWLRGYEATVSGAPVPVRVFNGMQPAVVLPPGTQGEVILRYRPAWVRWALVIALGSLATVLALLLRDLKRPFSGSA
jgi:hypothetical protein